MQTLLFPIQYGMLYFVGFDVLPPFIAWAAARSTRQEREEYLRAYAARLKEWQTEKPIPFLPLEEYDETFQRRCRNDDTGVL